MSTRTEQFRSNIQRLCKDIKMPSFCEAYRQQWDDPAYAEMPFDQRLSLLLEAEKNARCYKSRQRLLKNARLPQGTVARLENIDWDPQRGLNKALIEELCDCSWMTAERKPWITISGVTGVGKSYIGNVLTYQACIHGFASLYYRMPELINDIESAIRDHSINDFRKMLLSKKLLTIDEFGTVRMTETIATEFLTLLNQKLNETSLILIGQIPLEEWHNYLGEPVKADGIMDRIINQSYRISLKGNSMRAKYAAVKAQKEDEGEV